MKFFREIRKVGLRDWLWFVVFMQRDEFHPRLNRINYSRGRARSGASETGTEPTESTKHSHKSINERKHDV